MLNKIDLPGADPDRIKEEVEAIIGLDCDNAIPCSRTGLGADLASRGGSGAAPKDAVEEPTKALIFDSYYDPYWGVIVYFRDDERPDQLQDKVLLMASRRPMNSTRSGSWRPIRRWMSSAPERWVIWRPRSRRCPRRRPRLVNALPGYTEAKPMVFCGLFPTEPISTRTRDALDKLQLSDAALLQAGKRHGLNPLRLPALHMEIVQERLERIRPRSDRHRAIGDLQGEHDRWIRGDG